MAFITVNAQQPAFPGAEGYGKYAVGGRGGVVIKVTNLNDSGTGSLREAVEASGARTVIFEVGGRINLSSSIRIDNPYITIAGQHSVGDGITLSMEGTPNKFLMVISTEEVIIRYLTFRRSSTKVSAQNSDGLYIATGSNNVMVDHCSFSWASDENLSMADYSNDNETKGCTNITIQYCMMTNAYGGNNKSNLVSGGASEITWWRNAWISAATRNPSVSTPVEDAPNYDSYFEVANNFYFDCLNGPSFNINDTTAGLFYANILNNRNTKENGVSKEQTRRFMRFGGSNQTRIYVEGNITLWRPTDDLDEWEIGQQGGGSSDNMTPVLENRKSYTIIQTPLVTESVTLWDAVDVWTNLKDDAGASLPTRDSEDTRAILSVENGIGTQNVEANTFPIINNGTPLTDTDNDGMPEEWEIINGLDVNNPDDRNIINNDGYTNLEHYLNGIGNGFAGADASICEGENATITATGAVTYMWNTGENTASITVTPSTTTTYTVTATDTDGNIDTDQVTVTVNPIPIVDAGTDVTINIGESTTLTATGTDTYLWNTGETTASIIVTPTVDTTYSVTGTTNNCENTDSVTVFSVVGSAIANAGEDTAICQGETTTLMASGGDSYLWNTGETTASIAVNPTETRNYTVIVSNSTSSDTDDVTVFVNPLPDVQVSDDTTILRGTFITLSATGANNYEWSNGATEPNIAVGPNSTTAYQVTGYINNCSDVKQVTIEVLEEVIANAGEDFTVCGGDEVTLTASGGDSYIWNTGEVTQSIIVIPLENTTYTVIVSNALDSDADEATVFVDECIDENQDDFQFMVFPNPTNNGVINIKLFGLKNLSSLYIHDIIGKLVLRENLDDNNGQTIQKQIDISSFSKGMYFITLFELDRTTTKKIIFN